MIGAQFSNWGEVVDAAYYAGYGGGEALWLFVSIILCIVACFWGHTHENKVNSVGH